MAIRTKENTSAEVAKQVPPMFKERVIMRILDASFTISKEKGNPMIVLETELLKPTEYSIGGITYKELDNKHFRIYLMLTADGLPFTLDTMERLGLTPQIDDEQPDTEQFKGLVFAMILSSRERKAQKPDPNKPGAYVNVLDAKGQPITQGWEWVADARNILERAENELGAETVRP